jgi:hypothetical protein
LRGHDRRIAPSRWTGFLRTVLSFGRSASNGVESSG